MRKVKTKEKVSGIYKIVNKLNQKYYVGSSNDILGTTYYIGRFKSHKNDLIKECHSNEHLQRAWNMYGEENFDFIIAEQVSNSISRQELFDIEQKYLDIAAQEKDKCYNILFKVGVPCSPETVEKSRLGLLEYYRREGSHNTGRRHTEETKRKMSENNGSMKGADNPNFGRKLTKEQLANRPPQKRGIQNSLTDPTIFSFRNKETKEEFSGTKADFRYKFDLDQTCVLRLCQGKVSSTKNWELISRQENSIDGNLYLETYKEKSKNMSQKMSGDKNPRFDHKIYSFTNQITKEVFSGTRFEFGKKFNVNCGPIDSLISGKIKMTKCYWVLTGTQNPRHDQTIYSFRNRLTNEVFTGTQFAFRIRFDLWNVSVRKLVKKQVNSTDNWVMVEKTEELLTILPVAR